MSKENMRHYPHWVDSLAPVWRFRIGDRWLCVYRNVLREPLRWYSVYWHDEVAPICQAADLERLVEVIAGVSEEYEKWEMDRPSAEQRYNLDRKFAGLVDAMCLEIDRHGFTGDDMHLAAVYAVYLSDQEKLYGELAFRLKPFRLKPE